MLTRRLALLFAIPWSLPAAAENTFTLETLMASMARTGEKRATFKEFRRFAVLDNILESRGHLVSRPGYLEKVTDWPVSERLEVEGDRVVLTAGNEAPRVIELSMVPALRVLIDAIRGPLAGDAAGLQRVFATTLTGTVDAWSLALVPREAAAARLLRSVQLDGHRDAIERITLTQANGDEQLMLIAGG